MSNITSFEWLFISPLTEVILPLVNHNWTAYNILLWGLVKDGKSLNFEVEWSISWWVGLNVTQIASMPAGNITFQTAVPLGTPRIEVISSH